MSLLKDDKGYSIVELEELLKIDERTFYRYQKYLLKLNFYLLLKDGKYKMDKPKSSFDLFKLYSKSSYRNFFIKEKKFDLLDFYKLTEDSEANNVPLDYIDLFLKESL